jgi:hypothetical protein
MPIGADLVLHEESDPEQARNDGAALGRVIEKTARRWATPLAIPLMDLRLEKSDLLAGHGITTCDAEKFHFTEPLHECTLDALCAGESAPLCRGSIARDQALSYIASFPDLIPIGMAIGPFSLVSRLMPDPITAIAMAGTGVAPEDSDEVRLLWQCLHLAEAAVQRSVRS